MTSATENRTIERVDHPPRVREAIDELMREKDAIDNRTTELREKLTERGVDWLDESNGYADVTTFIANGAKWTVVSKSYLNPEHDWMTLRAEHITPEQAIAATLGNTTCEYVIEDNMNETEGMGDVWFRCTNCDMCFDYADDWLLKMPYCPHCGARVKARNE